MFTLRSLKELNLSQNKLRSLPEQMFYDLKYLELLDLSKNKLQGLPQEVLQTLSKSVKKVCLDGKELDSELDGEQVGTELDGKQHHIALDGKQLEIVLEGDQLDTSQIKPKKNIHTMDQIPAKSLNATESKQNTGKDVETQLRSDKLDKPKPIRERTSSIF
uniref:Uncharacterized protein n=1 Tax=Amorphochlora amoebiformis TaxID=1561963 RepID=A0A7S0DGE0_9EUKA|mmetsp:Transcript_24550/g.38678  ORF Transcript_24550/g.38678 Transcript_24550/m.38678 type:complete len:161 (+) Transcript_24550:1004-1486(+)